MDIDTRSDIYSLGVVLSALADDRGNVSVRRFADLTEMGVLPGLGWPPTALRFDGSGRFLAARYERPPIGIPDSESAFGTAACGRPW